MSVVIISLEEWERLRASILHDELFYPFSDRIRTMVELLEKRIPDSYQREKVAQGLIVNSLVERLAMANRSAFALQYGEKVEPLQLSNERPEYYFIKDVLDWKQLAQLLGSVEYNCVDNAGYSTLPADLKEWFAYCREKILVELSR